MQTSLYHLIEQQQKKNPHKIAVIGEKKYSYKELFNQVLYFAYILRSVYSVKKGDNIGIFLPNIPEFAVVILALNKIGAVAVAINIRLDNKTLNFILKDSAVKLVITNLDYKKKFRKYFSYINKIIVVEEKEDFFWDAANSSPFIVHEKKIKCSAKASDVAIIIYTSGTTGIPKGAMMTNGNLLFNCRSCKRGFGLTHDDIQLIVVPLFHVTGLNSQLLASIYMGGTSVLLKEYHTYDVFKLLMKHKVTIFIAVPSVFILLLEKFKKQLKKLTSLKKIGYAGAPMPVNTILAWKKQFSYLKCYNFYGLTETSSITTVLTDKYSLITPDSVGTPVPGVKLKIVDDRGKEVTTGLIGELTIKGGNVVKGYFNNPLKTKKNIVNGWLHSGDMAKMDNKQRIFLLGRKKEIINRGGEKISPIVLENKLYNHPKIFEAAVVGVPNKIFGQTVRLCIVKKEGVTLTKKELEKFMLNNFAEYERTKDIVFLSLLPRNANGKVQKNLLVGL